MRGIDHVYVPFRDARRAFDYLTGTWRLPVTWPFADHGSFSSGGVGLGNLNLEVLQSSPGVAWFRAHQPARVQGIAFEPAMPTDAFVAALDERGVEHTEPMHAATPNGLHWTNVGLPSLTMGSGTTAVFSCEYPGPRDPMTGWTALQRAGGGVLGVVHAEAIVATTPAIAAWTSFLGDAGGAAWRFDHGPDLHLEHGPDAGVRYVLLRVRSMEDAVRALLRVSATISWDGPLHQATLPDAPLEGLRIRLVDRGPAFPPDAA